MYCRVYCRVPSLESLTLGTVCPSGNLALGTMVTCTAAATLEGSNFWEWGIVELPVLTAPGVICHQRAWFGRMPAPSDLVTFI